MTLKTVQLDIPAAQAVSVLKYALRFARGGEEIVVLARQIQEQAEERVRVEATKQADEA
jgi:hypothetical protein